MRYSKRKGVAEVENRVLRQAWGARGENVVTRGKRVAEDKNREHKEGNRVQRQEMGHRR